jgi:hypothetical protein
MAVVLENPAPEAVLGALVQLVAAAAPDETLFFYYSGHGNGQELHLGGRALPLDRLERAIDGASTRLRIVVIDACRTAMRQKGVVPAPELIVRADAAASSAGAIAADHEGRVTVLAASAGEPAQESDQLRGGVFTHYLVSGLRGAADADRDLRVTLAEAYEFAYRHTLARAAAATGIPQRPELVVDLRGHGPLVLTTLAADSARLVLPPGDAAHYLVFEKDETALLAEAWGSPEAPTTLAVAPGAFVVHRRDTAARRGGRAAAFAAEITVAAGQRAALAPSDFVRVAPERLTARGGAVELYPRRIGLAYGMAIDGGPGRTQRLAAAYSQRAGPAVLRVRIGGGLSRYETAYNRVDDRSVDAWATVGLRGRGRRLRIEAGAGVTTRLLRRRMDDLSVPASAAWRPPADLSTGTAAGPAAYVALQVPAGARATIEGTLEATAPVTRAPDPTSSARLHVEPSLGATVGVLWSF